MYERIQTLLPAVLALTFVTLLAIPVTALAQSGLPATVTMFPEAAGPGATVEVTGLDYPANATVELMVATPAGTVPVATATSGAGGSFRKVVTLPAGVPEGGWQLHAISSDGTNASYGFDTGDATAAPVLAASEVVSEAAVEPIAAAAAATAASAVNGNSFSDGIVLVILGVVLGAVMIGSMFAWRLVHEEGWQPGMGAGEDLIWSGTSSEATLAATPEATASDEPHWESAAGET